MDMGARIQRAWRAWVRSNVSARAFRREIASIDWRDAGDVDLYLYVMIGKVEGEPQIERVEGPMVSDYFLCAGHSKLLAVIPVFEGMTRRDLLEFDVAEDTAYWDDPDWGAE